MSEGKDSKAAVLYYKPKSINRKGGARCGACWKFVAPDAGDSGGCLEVVGDILRRGVCGLYVNGVPHKHEDREIRKWRITRVSKEESGYEDDGDTHCVSCTFMAEPGNASSPCEEVEGLVEQEGCCNEHEHRRSNKR